MVTYPSDCDHPVARTSHTTALRVASTRAFGGARGGPDGFAVGIGVIYIDRDSSGSTVYAGVTPPAAVTSV